MANAVLSAMFGGVMERLPERWLRTVKNSSLVIFILSCVSFIFLFVVWCLGPNPKTIWALTGVAFLAIAAVSCYEEARGEEKRREKTH